LEGSEPGVWVVVSGKPAGEGSEGSERERLRVENEEIVKEGTCEVVKDTTRLVKEIDHIVSDQWR